MSTCGDCKHFTGGANSYMALCSLHKMRVEFNFCCADFADATGTVKKGQSLLGYFHNQKNLTDEDKKDLELGWQQYRDYNSDRGDKS